MQSLFASPAAALFPFRLLALVMRMGRYISRRLRGFAGGKHEEARPLHRGGFERSANITKVIITLDQSRSTPN